MKMAIKKTTEKESFFVHFLNFSKQRAIYNKKDTIGEVNIYSKTKTSSRVEGVEVEK